MAKTLEQIIGFENLTGIITDPRGGVPADILPPAFINRTSSKKVMGNTAKYTVVDGNRSTARLVQYGAPSQRRNLRGISERPVVLMHTHEHIVHDTTVLGAIRQFDNPQVQARGAAEVDRQTVEFKRGLSNLHLSTVYSIFRFGQIYFDGDGNLLPTSSGAVTTVDFQVPAGNKDQLDWDGNGAIIGASWATAGTDIIGDIEELNQAARQLTGYPLKHAFHGTKLLTYFLTNTHLKELINRNAGFQAAAAAGMIPNGFLGFQWHPVYEAFFNDADGTDQTWFGDDIVAFTPEPTPDWWEWIDGSYEVPTNIGTLSSDGLAALGQFRTVHGMFSYAKVIDDPAGIKHNMGDTFLPTLKVPKSIFIADVTP